MREIHLSTGGSTVVDDEDYGALAAFSWRSNAKGYVIRYARDAGRCVTVYMHREIVRASPGQEVDHANADKRDNRRANLRPCSHSQNAMNRRVMRSGFKGVCWHKRRQKWVAAIHVDGRQRHLGYFESEKAAAIAYDEAAVATYGEFARTNFPA